MRRAVGVALAGVAGLLPVACSAAPAGHGGVGLAAARDPIRHVVVVDLENHTFDSLLGFWCDQNRSRCLNGSGNFVGEPGKVTLADGAVVTPSDAPAKVPMVAHNVLAQQTAMNIQHGVPQMNGWDKMHALPSGPSCTAATNPPYQCITSYEPSQIPNLVTIARKFAMSDMTFSLSDSPSWEGHFEVVTATNDGFVGYNPLKRKGYPSSQGWGCDSGKFTLWQASPSAPIKNVPACIPDPALNPVRYPNGGAVAPTPVQHVPTIMNEMTQAGLSWKIYSATKGTKGYGIWDICPSLAGCLDTSQISHMVPDGHFNRDAAAGTLPDLSIITPGGSHFMDAGHNGMSITAMDNWLGDLVNAVEKSPEWKSTAMFITWDDCGCFYDQVPPPHAPDGSQEGPRVPLLIVSPYAKPGYTDTTPTTFAGILAYTEATFGLSPLGVDDARSYGFAKAFNYSQTPLRAAPMITQPLPLWARQLAAHPPRSLVTDPT